MFAFLKDFGIFFYLLSIFILFGKREHALRLIVLINLSFPQSEKFFRNSIENF